MKKTHPLYVLRICDLCDKTEGSKIPRPNEITTLAQMCDRYNEKFICQDCIKK